MSASTAEVERIALAQTVLGSPRSQVSAWTAEVRDSLWHILSWDHLVAKWICVLLDCGGGGWGEWGGGIGGGGGGSGGVRGSLLHKLSCDHLVAKGVGVCVDCRGSGHRSLLARSSRIGGLTLS